MEYLSLLQKRGLSYAISGFSIPSPKPWTIICNFWNFFLFSKNMDYHMQFQEFQSLHQKHGLSYIIYRISFTFPKHVLSYACFMNSLPFSINMDYHMQF